MAGKDISRQDGDTKLFVNHKPKNTHLCRTSVIKLNRPLLQLGRIIKLVPSKVKLSITEITDELRLVIQPIGIAIHDLRHGKESHHLRQNGLAIIARSKSLPRSESSRNIRGKVGETVSTRGGEVSHDGEHGNASMLQFDETKAIESFLVGIIEHSEWIEESEGGLSSEFGVECSGEGSVGLGDGGWGECGGGAGEGGEEGELHHDVRSVYG
mmetsp:Transcript_14173/g.21376  ORF Transcript_14173/g.21376 Transcript_14173/m.21376 type:complete len:212 (-) Transcript_14173:43-678(-)